MRDCPNGAVRDLLPDLLHDRLNAERRATVRAHVEGCADCQAELALLSRVRAHVRAPQVDTGRVIAALPAYRAPSAWRRALRSPALRAAAAVVLVAGAAGLLLLDRTPGVELTVADSNAVPRAVAAAAEVSLGETFYDISDTDLRALVDELGDVDAVMIEEPSDVVVPIGMTEDL